MDKIDCSHSQVVLYKGEDLQSEKRRLIRQLYLHLFRREERLYPIHQWIVRKQMRCLVARRSLPYQTFSAIFPQVSQITPSKNQVYLVFELFRQLAGNPLHEIAERFIWKYYGSSFLSVFGIKNHSFDATICGVTYEALLVALFGRHPELEVVNILSNQGKKEVFQSVRSVMKQNLSYLQEYPGKFIGYFFGIMGGKNYCGHAFTVIQYINKRGAEEFRLFQSYIKKYTLKTYIDKDCNTFTSDQFDSFLEGVQDFLLKDRWTNELEEFYEKYFHANSGLFEGEINRCTMSELQVSWGIAGINDVLTHASQFKRFKESNTLPQIEILDSSVKGTGPLEKS